MKKEHANAERIDADAQEKEKERAAREREAIAEMAGERHEEDERDE